MLRNVYNVRVNVMGKDKALEPKVADELNILEMLQAIKDKHNQLTNMSFVEQQLNNLDEKDLKNLVLIK